MLVENEVMTMLRYSKLIMASLLFITTVAVSVAIWSLYFREPDVVLTPDYAPKETEPNAEEIPGDSDVKLEVEDGGGAIGIEYVPKVTIDLSKREAQLSFSNPGKSTQDVVLQIVVQNTVLVQSGRIEPGNRVQRLSLLDGIEKMLSEGGYDGKFVILSYDPASGEKSMVNTEAHITVDVQK
jgi:hypothetical protein